ncbi:MAG: globin [Wenzhouxiangella sp.]|nr:globin [Wenzhouxiangella sp.]TVR95022.1 MAG: globin [Wenzhouxiangellaceae bacterium]
MAASNEEVQGSYGRCLKQKGFISRFYELLMERDPRIPKMFEGTNWTVQNKALRRGISIALTYAGGSAIVERSMKEMATVHSRKGRAPVDPKFYVHWRESLLQAVSEFDPRFNGELRQAWDEALTKTTDLFTEAY